jgi:hypothetical protein
VLARPRGLPALDCSGLFQCKVGSQRHQSRRNLGADVHYSGTVAAVREAVLHGWPGAAVSQYRRRGMEFDWERATKWVARVLADLLDRPTEPGLFYNVNLPHLGPADDDPEIVFCPLDPHPLPLSYRRTRQRAALRRRLSRPAAHAWSGRGRLLRRAHRRDHSAFQPCERQASVLCLPAIAPGRLARQGLPSGSLPIRGVLVDSFGCAAAQLYAYRLTSYIMMAK